MDAASRLAAYAEAWRDGRPEAIAAHWAREEFRFYKAEEIGDVFTTWAGALAYWRGNAAMHQRVRLGFTELHPVPLDGAWSLLWCRMRWDIRFSGAAPAPLAGTAMGGDNRVLALFNGDLLAGWSETPDAPVLAIRALHHAQARDI